MLKPLRVILIASILFCALLSPEQARADAAPYQLPGGAALDPGDATTLVRMMAETVTIEVAPPNPDTRVSAQVTADFTFRNLGDAPEPIVVGFPLTCPDCISHETGTFDEINDLTVYVNTLQVATRVETATYPSHFVSYDWAVFDVTFPPGQDVFIRVTYTAGGTKISDSYRIFEYVLETGAGWYDTIGSADIIARLPYLANDQNTFFGLSGPLGDSENIPPIISGNELRWHFEELEPTDDFGLTIVHPWLWFTAMVEEENVRLNPQDGESWGRLGRAFKQMLWLHKYIRIDIGGEQIYAQAVEAYQHATTLLPDDSQWHAGFAELLFTHFFFVNCFFRDSQVDDLSELTRAVDEVRRSLEIDPDNELALDIVDQVNFSFPGAVLVVGGAVDYPILTSTAGYSLSYWQALETPSPTRTPRLPITPHPTRTPKPTATPEIIASNTVASAQGKQIPASPSVIADNLSLQATVTPAEPSTIGGISPLWIDGILLLLSIGLVWLLRRKHA